LRIARVSGLTLAASLLDRKETANQQVTVVVDGFNTNDAGPYTLTATFE
jgi:hypothetical protein